MQLSQSSKLAEVCYDIRGPVLQVAKQLESQGHRILKLNIGNPAPFGFTAPDEILVDVCRNLSEAQGYSDSHNWKLGAKEVMMQPGGASRTVTVTGIFADNQLFGTWIVSNDTLRALTPSTKIVQDVGLVRAAGWSIGNVDTTVVLEAPRLAPHKGAMEQRLSEVAGAPVSVKAKRAEGLGALGRGEGVACFAAAVLTG